MKRIWKRSAAIAFIFFNSSFALANNQIVLPQKVEVESGSEIALPIKIEANETTSQAMLLVRGMPRTATLSDGRLFPSGTWVVRWSPSAEVRLITSEQAVEQARIEFSLVAFDGKTISTAFTLLNVRPDAGAVLGQARQDSPEVTEQIRKIMERADRYLDEGRIAVARRMYTLVANKGFPEGAEAVARTYDPEYLQRYPVMGGIKPNKKLAADWYGRADVLRSTAFNSSSVADNPN